MPKVKASSFCCPACGKPTFVLRTRAATSTRLIRYRRCEDGHRIRTDERINEPLNIPVRLALQNICDNAGIVINSHSSPGPRKDN